MMFLFGFAAGASTMVILWVLAMAHLEADVDLGSSDDAMERTPTYRRPAA